MTLPVPNLKAQVVDKQGYLLPPWNSFFQQLVQRAPAVQNVSGSPFTANQNGTVILKGAATVHLTRGNVSIDLSGVDPTIIPISISDTVTWTGSPTVQFLGA